MERGQKARISLSKLTLIHELSRDRGNDYSILNHFCNALTSRRGSQVRKMALDDVTKQHRLTQG